MATGRQKHDSLGGSRGKGLSPQLSGGGGFDFEDKVAAFYLSALLAGERPFIPHISHCITEVSWQVGERGWRLDDLLLRFEDGKPIGRMALSIKRKRQVTSKGFPESFVRAAWTQWLARDIGSFDREEDFLGLVVGQLAQEVEEAWEKLLEEAIHGEPGAIAERFSLPRSGSNRISHALFQSLRCPPDLLATEVSDATEVIRLIRRLRLLSFDFRSGTSTRMREGMELCRKSLESDSFDEAQVLWEQMLGISAQRRPLGGSMERQTLVNLVRTRHRLKVFSDHRKDWQRLEEISLEASGHIKGSSSTRVEKVPIASPV